MLLAGILLLAHGIIPHHHHDLEYRQCAAEQIALQGVQSYFLESCACNHGHEHSQDHACHITTKTVVKSANTLQFALPAKALQLNVLVQDLNFSYGYFSSSIFRGEISHKPSRAPPVA